MVHEPLGMSLRPFQGSSWAQKYFYSNTDIICLFHHVDICTNAAKTAVNKNRWHLSRKTRNQTIAVVSYILHLHTLLFKKERHFH